MVEIVFFILGLYLLIHSVIFFGLVKSLRLPGKIPLNLPFISVIAAVKNEEKHIAACIESLLKLDYPDDKIEIIIVNNNSDDTTGKILYGYSQKYTKIRYIETRDEIGILTGKPHALAEGINKSKGEIIFTTDADCIVKKSWAKGIVKHYDEHTGVVCGFTIPAAKNFFGGIQAFDWLYLLSLSSGSAGIGSQLSCVGNNMSFRRKAYDDAGGFENIEFSVTEDFKLLQTIRKKTGWKTRFPVDFDCLNRTEPCPAIKDVYRQKKRWATGGLEINWFGWLVGITGWLTAAAIMLGWTGGVKFYLIFLAGKILIDLIFVFPVLKSFGLYRLILYLIPFEIYFTLYAFSLPVIVFTGGPVIWKGKEY